MKSNGKTWIIFTSVVLFAALLAACAPSQGGIETAIAQTVAAHPTDTPAPKPTQAPTSPPKALPTATAATGKAPPVEATAAPAPSGKVTPTPEPKVDPGVIDVNPRNLILTKQDLPADGHYILPFDAAYGPVTNAEVVANLPEERRKAFLDNSGRIYGYETEFLRGSYKYDGPDEVRNQVVIYETVADASAAVAADADCARFAGFDRPTQGFSIGDTSAICVQEENGRVAVWLAFAYRNQVAVIEGEGTEAKTPLAFFQDLAEKQLALFKEQPVSGSVTFVP